MMNSNNNNNSRMLNTSSIMEKRPKFFNKKYRNQMYYRK